MEESLIRPTFIPKNIIGIDLSIRKWECPKCHTKHKRDFNASVNIMFEG